MLKTTRPTAARLLACSALPLVVLVAMLYAYRGVAPLWAGGSTDPSYGYLLNSLMAAELRVPMKTDHPGIPLDLLGALMLRLWHLVTGSSLPLRDHVLRDPEPFLAVIVVAILLVCAASSAFLGWATCRLTGRYWLAVLAQASPYLCFEVFRSGVQVMCEPLLLAGATALSALLLLTLVPEGNRRRPLEAAMGVVLGLGLATKLVFLPAAIPALVAARSGRGRLRIAIWGALGFGACLLVIAPRVPATTAWMWRLFAHSGYHGQGAATVIDPARYGGGFLRLLLAELPLHAAFAAGLAICLWPRPAPAFTSSARRMALGLFGAWAVTLVAAAKQPQAHYLVTVAGLVPPLLVLALWRLQLTECGRSARGAQAAVAIVLVAGIAHAARGVTWLMGIRTDAKTGARSVATAAAVHQAGVLQGHRVSTIPAALASGDEWTDLVFSSDLRRLYPDFLAFDCEGLQAFGEDATPRDVVGHVKPDGTALMQDALWRPLDQCAWTAALPRKTIASGGRDSLYEARLLPPPSKDAGPWIGGMLIVAGMEGGAGTGRWATGRHTSLLFAHRGGPLTLDVAAGHEASGDQALSILANGVRVERRTLPRLPAMERFTVPIEARPGWNEIQIVYDSVVPAVPHVETALLGVRTRARSPVTPAVLFTTLELLGPR